MKLEEQCEGKLSSTVPWEHEGVTPLSDPIIKQPMEASQLQTS